MRRVTWQFLAIESRPFVTLDFDYADPTFAADTVPATLVDDIVDTAVVDEAIVKVRYRATEEQARRVDHAAVTRALYEAGAHKVVGIKPEIVRAARARVEGVDEELAPLSALELWIASEELDDLDADGLRELGARYLETVGS